MITATTFTDLKPILMRKSGSGVKTPYYLIEDNKQAIFVVSAGHNGAEFNKTLGYSSNFPGVQRYVCLYGSGIMLMQRNDELQEAKEFKVVMLNPHKYVTLAAGWMMCLINTGSSYLVVLSSNVLDEKNIISKAITEKRGFVYYVVEKKGEIAFEQNPSYTVHPQIATE